MQRDHEFSDYVRARRPRLVATAYLLCGDRHAAEDLVQTALARLYVAWPRVRRTDSEDAYARRVLVYASIDAHRRPCRRERTTAEVPDRRAPQPFDPADRDELVRALATLAPRQRRVIVLRYWLGLTILSACRKPPWPAFPPYTCRWATTVDGKRVLVGTSNVRGYKSYLAGYVRPDGQLVTVRVESGMHNDPDTPQPSNPVRNPEVTTEQLIAAATDRRMTLR